MLINQIQPTNTINPATTGGNIPSQTITEVANNIPGSIENVTLNKNLSSYDQFVDEIQTVTRLIVSEEFQKYAKTDIMNRSVLETITTTFLSINNYSDNDWLIEIFRESPEDLLAFLDTAFEYELITSSKLNIVKNDVSVLNQMFSGTEITYILNKQRNFNVYIPTKEDLINFSNIEQLLLDVIKQDPSSLFDPVYIKELIGELLIEKFRENNFISSYKMELLYATPSQFFVILDNDEIRDLLFRVKPYLSFISDEYETNVNVFALDNDILNEDIISINEIKLILDKEVDLKNHIIRLFNYQDVNTIFGDFKEELFQNEFSDLINEAVAYNLIPDVTVEQTQLWIDDAVNPLNP